MLILGRTYANGTEADYAAVNALQEQYKLVPLSSFGKPFTFQAPPVDPNPGFSMTDKPQAVILGMAAEDYFNRLARLMADGGPAGAGGWADAGPHGAHRHGPRSALGCREAQPRRARVIARPSETGAGRDRRRSLQPGGRGNHKWLDRDEGPRPLRHRLHEARPGRRLAALTDVWSATWAMAAGGIATRGSG